MSKTRNSFYTAPSRQPPSTPPDSGATVAAIIPAHNEAGRIGRVLAVLRETPLLDEIIVVDDGSADGTFAETAGARSADPRVRVLRLPSNQGKGAALLAGARAARSDLLLLLDADLINLRPAHVAALIQPVLAGRADMALGLFRGGHLSTDLAHRATPWLTGQRCLPAELLRKVSEASLAGYGAETAITLTARRQGWHCVRVPLRGVSHPPSEIHRRLWPGVRVRVRMYGEILRAWRLERGWQSLFTRRSRRARLALAMASVLLISSVAYDRSLAASHLSLAALPVLPLAGVQRLLVIAPHPDDETLGAGGAIQAALAAGAQVKVVVLTNGDGQALGPLILERKVIPRPAYYIATGRQRQEETRTAMRLLGLPGDAVIFLGYPDGQLDRLWLGDWTSGCPLRSRYTRATGSPYPDTFNSQATYCGADLLADLQSILLDFKPDLVLMPHPNDDHADHRAGSDFARLALILVGEQDASYHPKILAYLIHYGFFPQPRGLRPDAPLLPPAPLTREANQWVSLDLNPAQVRAKTQAVQAYRTQLRMLGSFLPSFARRNEIYSDLQPLDVSPLALNSITLEEPGGVALPITPEPAGESTRRLLLSGADLVGLQISRMGNTLWLTARTEGSLVAGLRYRLLVKTPDGHTLVASYPGAATASGRTAFTLRLDLDQMGDPRVLGFAAEVSQGATLDRTGWHFVTLHGGAP